MGVYENGVETRNRILEACRKLFYEKGYDKTTFVDICREADVNQSSIHYHFKAKQNILKIIYGETIEKNNLIAEEICGADSDEFVKFIFGGELYLYKMLHDDKFRRFNIDAVQLLNPDAVGDFMSEMAKILLKEDAAEMTMNDIELHELMALVAYDNVVRLYVNSHVDECNYRKLSDMSIEIYSRILNKSSKEIENVKKSIRRAEKKMRWSRLECTLDPVNKYIE